MITEQNPELVAKHLIKLLGGVYPALREVLVNELVDVLASNKQEQDQYLRDLSTMLKLSGQEIARARRSLLLEAIQRTT